MLVSLDTIKRMLAERVDDLVPRLCPNARVMGHDWALGDIDGAPGTHHWSLRIGRVGGKAGVVKDFAEDGRRYSLLDLIARNACGGDFVAAIKWARDYLQLGGLRPDQALAAERRAQAQRARIEADAGKQAAKKQRAARALWHQALPIAGTPVERYLLGRAIDLRTLGKAPGALRWHPECWCAEVGAKLPAMLAMVNDAADWSQLGTHRTWLALHADGRVTKAALADAKKSLGPVKGGHIPLWRGDSGKPWGQAPDGEWVAIAEGIEDGLSIAGAMPHQRVVCGISLSMIGEVRLPAACGGLYVAADNDAGVKAQEALARALGTLEHRGVATRVARAPEGCKDFNAWAQQLAAPAADRASA